MVQGDAGRSGRNTIVTNSLGQRWQPWRCASLAVAGVLQAFSTAWPWGGGGQAFGSLQVLAMAVALVLIAGPADAAPSAGVACGSASTRFWSGFWRGWCFAAAWLMATFWWLYISMHVYGGLPGWLAALAVLLLAAALALYYALACGLWLLARPALGAIRQALLWATLWLLAELCRGVLFTGFPWGATGYAHVDSLLAGYAPWLGVYGIGALAAFLSAVLGQTAQRVFAWRKVQGGGRRRFPVIAAMLVVIVLAPGWWLKRASVSALQPISGESGVHVALLQGNIAQEEKFQPNGGVETALQWYGQQMREVQADLLVLPETALPLFPQQLPQEYWQGLQKRFASGGQAALIGVPAGDGLTGYANAVVGMASGGAQVAGVEAAQPGFSLPPASQAEYRYAKHHLVPFGEFVPFGFQWFVDRMQMPLGSFQRGALAQPRLLFKGERLQPNICYEDLFGEELAASFIDPATSPTILVNMSNIAWFGDTVAIDQHRQISRMRAMELARPMLRATNTGSTAVIDAGGRVLQELPRQVRGVLHAKLAGNHAPPTFYAWWAARWGLWPLWVLALMAAPALMWCRPRKAA